MNITVISGPNLNMLGKRDPEHYGAITLEKLQQGLTSRFPECSFRFFQSNHEGKLIDFIHELTDAKPRPDGLIVNFGGFTHTSVALRDALELISFPIIEVHLSNIHAREPFRHESLTAGAANGVIAGFGSLSYELAVQAMKSLNKPETPQA